MKNKQNETKVKKKNTRKPIDLIILLVLIILVIAMLIFTSTRETSNQEIILFEIYKSAGPNTSSASMDHYFVYSNTNLIGIRNNNSDGSNNTHSKEIEQTLIDNFKVALDDYMGLNPTINTSFYINERYTIEYNGGTITVPNPTVVATLDLDSNQYNFYYTIENFINQINN